MSFKKVHKKGTRWFRDDTGSLVGEEIPESQKLENLKIMYGDHIICQKNNNYIIIYYGYFDENGNFFRFCRKKDCRLCAGGTRTLFCPNTYTDNPCKIKTGGYYIKTGPKK